MNIDFVLTTIVLEQTYQAALYAMATAALTAHGFFVYKKISPQTYRRILYKASVTWMILLVSRAVYYAWAQYSVWIENPVGAHLAQLGLEPGVASTVLAGWIPVFSQSGGYFLYYASIRFFLPVLLTIAASAAWYSFLKSLKTYRSRLFEEGEVELGWLCALLVGWPRLVVFIPTVLLIFIITAVTRRIVLKKEFTTIALSLFLALFTMLLASGIIMKMSVVRVLAL